MRGPFAFDAGAQFSLEDVLGCGPCGEERFLLRHRYDRRNPAGSPGIL